MVRLSRTKADQDLGALQTQGALVFLLECLGRCSQRVRPWPPRPS